MRATLISSIETVVVFGHDTPAVLAPDFSSPGCGQISNID